MSLFVVFVGCLLWFFAAYCVFFFELTVGVVMFVVGDASSSSSSSSDGSDKFDLGRLLASRNGPVDLLVQYVPEIASKPINSVHLQNQEYLMSIKNELYLTNLSYVTHILKPFLKKMSNMGVVCGMPIRWAMDMARRDMYYPELHCFVPATEDKWFFEHVATVSNYAVVCVDMSTCMDDDDLRVLHSNLEATSLDRDEDDTIAPMYIYVGMSYDRESIFRYIRGASLGDDFTYSNNVFSYVPQPDTSRWDAIVNDVLMNPTVADISDWANIKYSEIAVACDSITYSCITLGPCDLVYRNLERMRRSLSEFCNFDKAPSMDIYRCTQKSDKLPVFVELFTYDFIPVYVDINPTSDIKLLPGALGAVSGEIVGGLIIHCPSGTLSAEHIHTISSALLNRPRFHSFDNPDNPNCIDAVLVFSTTEPGVLVSYLNIPILCTQPDK